MDAFYTARLASLPLRPGAFFGLGLALALALPCAARDRYPALLRTEASEQLLRAGRQRLLAFRLPEAERLFRRLATRPDGAPAAYHYLATTALYKGMVTDDAQHFETFFERSDSLKTLLEEAPPDPWRAYLEAETNLQRALAAAKTGSYLRAALAARTAYHDFGDLIDEDLAFGDPYLGMGLLHLTVASLPGGWRRLLGVLGFSGTAEQAMRELQRAAEDSRLNQEQARILLALANIVIYQDTEEGMQQLRSLYQRRPESLLFAHLYGFALLADRHAVAAEDVLRDAAAKHTDPDYFFINYVEFYLAEALFDQGKFAEAETFYRRYLARHEGPALKALAHLHLGLALEMQGRREDALIFYRRVETTRDFDSDRAALRAARERLEAPLSARERTLLQGRNAFDAGRYDRAEQLLTQVFNAPEASADERAEAAYRLGRVFHVQGALARAAEAYAFVVAHPGDEHAKWAPWSQYYLGEIHRRRGEEARAVEAYEDALAYDGPFDYRQALEQVVRVALERVRG